MTRDNAKRVGGKISLNYRGLWLSFDCKFTTSTIYLAADKNGEVWAYLYKPKCDSIDKAFFSVADNGNSILVESYIKLGINWKNSVVKYTIK
jgi:hypothetical protein